MDGAEETLALSNLCDQKGITRAKEFITEFSDKLDEAESRYRENFDWVESRIQEAYAENNDLQKPILKGFREGKNTASAFLREYFYTERKCIQKINEMLLFLDNKQGSFWVSEEDVLVFENNEDLADYNLLAKDLMKLAKEEAIILQKLEEHKKHVFQKYH